MTRHSSCPSSFALQRFALTGEDSEGVVASHLASCDACQALVNEERTRGQVYMSSPAALELRRQLGGVAETAPGLQRSSLNLWAWGGGLAAAAALFLVLSPGFNPRAGHGAWDPGAPEELLPKGAVQLSLWVGDGEQADTLLAEPRVLHPADRVQPVLATPGKGFVALLLTTPEGKVIQLHPAGESRAVAVEPSAPAPLGPSFRLDEEEGVYHVTAFFAPKAFSTTGLAERAVSARKGPFRGHVLVEQFEVRRTW